MKLRVPTKVVGPIVMTALAVVLAGCGGGSSSASGSSGGATSITVSYSEQVADELPLWIAQSAGYFKDEGLNVKLVSLSSDQGFPALISGQAQIASIGGTEIVSGVAAGADVKVLATLTPVFPYELFTKLTSASALKGKKIGITSKSGSLYVATLAALKQLGLKASDVTLVPLGSVTNVNNALLAGTIDAAVSHPPATTQFESAGFHSLLNLAAQKLPNINVGIAATSSYVSKNPTVLTKFMKALKSAINREKSDEKFSSQVLEKNLGIKDPKALQDTWSYYAKEVLPAVPTPSVDQLKAAQQTLVGSVPGVEKVDLSKIVDTQFVNQVFGS